MFDIVILGEAALLLLSAYLLGCILGYGTRRVLHAARGTRQVTPPISKISKQVG
ncbi:MAG TPA: hypothetical protein VIL88_13955 [Devosia sp.]|jgi:NADH-quinone oxidoreductase subunit E|uniref:hypothetical protein n=1 Tax=Devosia sp. TaxID=1871048 RepID=UPI002F95FDE0